MQTVAVSPVPVSAPVPVPWYRVGVMWVFVGGLGAVVVGSLMLLATAIEHSDVELHSEPMKPPSYYKHALRNSAPTNPPARPAP